MSYVLREKIIIDPKMIKKMDPVALMRFRHGGDLDDFSKAIRVQIVEAEKRHGPLLALLKYDDCIYLYQQFLTEEEVYEQSYRSIKWQSQR